jgi:RpiR family transcriptional regulator, carbohydrate utilization regulator
VDILYLIRSRLDQLSPTQLKVAEAILDDVRFAASAGIEQLAAKAGVSPAAMSRFAKAMDCDDIRTLRMRLAQAATVGQRFLDGSPAPAEPASFFGNIVGDIEKTLRRHLAGFDEQQFSAAVDLICQADRLIAFGVGGGSTVFSDELQFRLVRLGHVLTAYHDPVLMRITAATLGPHDLLIVLSTTGITPELLAAVDIARGYGTRLLALTRPDSPLARRADVVLPVFLDETDFIYKPTAARYGMLLAVDILATELALRQPEHSQELLRRVKLALDDYRHGEDRLPLGD